MSGYRPYPAYKPSGIDWLGDVPEHWDTRMAKFLFQLMSRPVRREDEIVTAFRDGTVTLRRYRRVEGFTNSVQEVGYQGVRKGDLVIHAMDAFAGAVGVSDSDGKSTPVYSVCVRRSPQVNTLYYARLVRHMALSGFISSLSKGIRERSTEFRYKEFAALALPLPPVEEQEEINSFLDRETARIDAAIGRYERLIALLQEKRQALISHAVTKGLDPNAPMKDSGVEWLGEVPAHWRVLKLGLISREIQTGPFGSQLHAEDYVQDGVPIVNPANIQAGTIMPDYSCTVDESTRKRLARHVLHSGDIVFGRRGEMGRCALVTEREAGWLCGTGSLKVRLDPQLADPQYLSVVLRTSGVRDWLLLQSVGSTMENLNTTILSRLSVPVPPLVEQEAIHAFLLHRQEIIQTLTAKAQKAIDLLREHRTSLISAAVTGKIDVQSTVAPLVCAHL